MGKADHYHQCDVGTTHPLELDLLIAEKKFREKASGLLPPAKRTHLLQFFIHLSLRFAHEHDFYSRSGMNINELQKRLKVYAGAKQHETGFIYNPAASYKIDKKNE